MKFYSLSQKISPRVCVKHNFSDLLYDTGKCVSSEIFMSVRQHPSMHFTLHNLKALFSSTHTQLAHIAFSLGKGLNFPETLWANHRKRRSDPAASERVSEVKESFQLKARSGGDNIGYYSLSIVGAGRILPAKVTKCSLFDQEAWKPENALSPGQIPFLNPMASCKSVLTKQTTVFCFESNVYSSPTARLLFTQKFAVYTVFSLCVRGLGSASPRIGGFISTEAWKPRQVLAGRACGHCSRTFSERALRRRPR